MQQKMEAQMIKQRKTTVPSRWLLPLLAGMLITIAVYSPSYIKTPIYAWWGTMYPQYCFSQNADSSEESVPIKIDFRWLHIK